MEDASMYHFSKKVLLLSILFILVNFGFYGVLFLVKSQGISPREIAPVLTFATTQRVELSSPYIPKIVRARPAQKILAGTTIQTTPQSFAELSLDNNVIRLDKNTRLKLVSTQFADKSALQPFAQPRLVFELLRGSVWVNAFDSIVFTTPRSEAFLKHTVGSITYNPPLNHLIVVRGSVDLTLKDSNKNHVANYVVPMGTQITYTDTQITGTYALLEYSKLRKELKTGSIPDAVLKDEWIVRNTRDDERRFVTDENYIFSDGVYAYKSRYLKFRERFAFVPKTIRKLRLERAQLILNYLLGTVHDRGDTAKATRLLTDFNALALRLKNDPAFIRMAEFQFYAIANVKFKSPAYLVKEDLRIMLINKDSPELLRSYFADADFYLRSNNTKAASELVSEWLSKWNTSMRSRHYSEFENQTRIFHQMLLVHANDINSTLLAQFDKTGDERIARGGKDSETVFDVTQERLSIIKSLVAARRYSDAKNYLLTSYKSLKIADLNVNPAARDVFLGEASFIASRIAYAQEFLHGSAKPINETLFKNFLATRQRDERLSVDLSTFLSANSKKTDLTNDRLFGTAITQETTSTDFQPDAGVTENSPSVSPKEQSSTDISAFITQGDESRRQQIVSQDLAVQLLITELSKNNVRVLDKKNVDVVDPATLTDFHITESEITDPKNLDKPIRVAFNYNLTTKIISDIEYLNADAELVGTFPLKGFDTNVLKAVYFAKDKRVALGLVQKEFKLLHLNLNPLGVKFISEDLSRFRFNNATLDTLPITIRGEFDRNTKKFISVKNSLYNQKNVSVETYLSQLVRLFTLNYLSDKGIVITKNQLIADFPYDRLRVIGYEQRGKFYDFTVDINSNLFRNITLQGSDASVESMTINDFKDL